ncbi:putative D-3-phosphoglycerate dehydrogenase [Podospora fimiseda]|uniref:D-3-phosphoglycerate dehydrogenase n=1 Tax=Podospora fimiseda TaxID=252190 RepID=A0AAN7GU26_9PEZI|nr:putative D-3-phosphoglycerate dehydrogenase [Podospora fimiseda]
MENNINKTLKGHKLLMVMPWEQPDSFLKKLSAEFPDLKVAAYVQPEWDQGHPPFPEEEWQDVTLLLTFTVLPTPEQAPNLQFVQLMSAGANHVLDAPIFEKTNVKFCTANGVHGPQIAEWIMGTYLSFQHRFPQYQLKQSAQSWDRSDLLLIDDSTDKTIGILGYGAIGRQTARLARALGMRVHAFTLHPRPTPESRRDTSWSPANLGDPEGDFPSAWYSGSSTEDLHNFLSSGLDLLVISTPLTPNTQHLLSKSEFEVLSKAGKGRTLISNIARGPVINTDDLVFALKEGDIRGAALDVTDPEPLPVGHELWGMENVIITPHVSGASKRYNERVLAILRENMGRIAGAAGRELVNLVDKREGY